MASIEAYENAMVCMSRELACLKKKIEVLSKDLDRIDASFMKVLRILKATDSEHAGEYLKDLLSVVSMLAGYTRCPNSPCGCARDKLSYSLMHYLVECNYGLVAQKFDREPTDRCELDDK